MAGDWIKMRGALLDHPKVIAMTRFLQQCDDYREWVTPGGGGAMNGKIVSDPALRAVTTGLLMRVWSLSREHGKFEGNDLHLEHSWIDDLDQFAGAPSFGQAMSSVGWVISHPTKKGVILPNFIEFNVPMTDAERQKGYRDRKKQGVTEASRTQRNENSENVTPREEKRREVKPLRVVGDDTGPFERFWAAWPKSGRKVAKAKCLDVWSRKGLNVLADDICTHVEAMKSSDQWRKGYDPAPLTYLNQQRWRDGSPERAPPRLAI